MKRPSVLLVSSKSYGEEADQKFRAFRFFPYSVVYLVNYLKKEGACDADYVDLAVQAVKALWQMVQTEPWDLVGFTSTTEARFSTIEKIRRIRQLRPGIKIVVGGHFFSSTSDEALRKIPEIDFVVRGEGEQTLAELVRALTDGGDRLRSVDGLSYREHGEVVHNPDRKAEADLGRFAIDFDLIAKPGYEFFFPMKNWEDRKDMLAFPLMLGRGCSQRCVFCTHRYLPFRSLKLEQIVAQINQARDRWGAKYFMFTDPSFSERRQMVRDLCTLLIDRSYDIRWYCESRVDIPADTLRLMAKAGCISVDFALESGSERVLQALGKRIRLSEIRTFAQTCNELGIRAFFFTMVSLPEEREEDLEKTFEVVTLLAKYGMRTSAAPLIIYPGTPLETMARERGVLPANFSWYDPTYRCSYSFIEPHEVNMPH